MVTTAVKVGTRMPINGQDARWPHRSEPDWRKMAVLQGLHATTRLDSRRDRYAQERGRDRCAAVASILPGEQLFQFLPQLSYLAILVRGFECVHGRSVIVTEFIHVFRWRARKVKVKRVSREG